MKGKGTITTYWLLGEKDPDQKSFAKSENVPNMRRPSRRQSEQNYVRSDCNYPHLTVTSQGQPDMSKRNSHLIELICRDSDDIVTKLSHENHNVQRSNESKFEHESHPKLDSGQIQIKM